MAVRVGTAGILLVGIDLARIRLVISRAVRFARSDGDTALKLRAVLHVTDQTARAGSFSRFRVAGNRRDTSDHIHVVGITDNTAEVNVVIFP